MISATNERLYADRRAIARWLRNPFTAECHGFYCIIHARVGISFDDTVSVSSRFPYGRARARDNCFYRTNEIAERVRAHSPKGFSTYTLRRSVTFYFGSAFFVLLLLLLFCFIPRLLSAAIRRPRSSRPVVSQDERDFRGTTTTTVTNGSELCGGPYGQVCRARITRVVSFSRFIFVSAV